MPTIQTVSAQGQGKISGQEQISCPYDLSATKRSLYTCLYHHSKKTQFSNEKGSEGSFN